MAAPERDAALFGRNLWRLLAYVRPYRGRALLGIVTNAAARGFDLLPLVIVGWAVDRIAVTGVTTAGADPWPFVLYGLLVLLGFLGVALFQSVSDYVWSSLAEKVRHDLRVGLYTHLQTLEAAFFEERSTGDLMSVLSNDVDNLETFLSDATTSIIRILITFVGTYALLAWMDWRLALLLFVPLPVVLWAVRFFATRVQPQYRKTRAAVGSINAVIEANLQGMGVIQAFTAEDAQEQRVRERSAEYRDAAVAAAKTRSLFIPLIYAIAGVSYAGLIGGGAWLAFSGLGPSVGEFTSFTLFSMRLVMPLFILGILINQLQRCEASAERVFDLLSISPRIADRPGARPLERRPRRLEFDGVRFAYPGREPVLHGVDLALESGKVIGIVGPTGAGKSTLIKLLLRYYDPDRGEIRLDGAPLGSLTLASLREHIGYVSQDAFLFSGTVADNIRLGNPEADAAAVAEAARVAGAAEFIEALPQGYDTWVGERGVKLSGGQRQRISLARAVLRNPALLVLDEATSAVDTRTEEAIQRNLHGFRADRMTLAVAHRLSTVRQSDEILVLVEGIVVERGRHEELLTLGGIYAELWAVQSGQANGGIAPRAAPVAG